MCLRTIRETYSEINIVWFEDILIVLLVSSLWLWLILILSKGRLISVNTKRTHEKTSNTPCERENEPTSETKKETR